MEQLTAFQRLEKVKNYYNYSTFKEFSDKIGLKNSQSLSNLKGKESPLSAKICQKVCEIHPQINFQWLYDGSGEMLKSQITQTATISGNNSGSVNSVTQTASELIYVLRLAMEQNSGLIEQQAKLIDHIRELDKNVSTK